LEDVHEQPNQRALAGMHRIDLTLRMGAPPVRVWQVLTSAPLLERWLSDQPVSVTTDWQPGSPMVTTGVFHGMTYVNRGSVRAYQATELLSYTYWSSLSEQPETPENSSEVEFTLVPTEDGTELRLAHPNLATPGSFGHWRFYWRMALPRLKAVAEER
jgi:uncharacterized protein YndB with AHSA1/START domain